MQLHGCHGFGNEFPSNTIDRTNQNNSFGINNNNIFGSQSNNLFGHL